MTLAFYLLLLSGFLLIVVLVLLAVELIEYLLEKNNTKKANKDKISNRQKLDLIASMCSEAGCSYKRGSEIERFPSSIYCIAHPSKDCPHLSWEKETMEYYKAAIDIL